MTFKIKECSSLLCPISYSIQKDIDVPALKNHHEYLNFILHLSIYSVGFPCGSEGKDSACNAGDLSLIPGSGRSSGEANGSPLQYSCLENPMDGEAWRATVHRVTKNLSRVSDSLSLFTFFSPNTKPSVSFKNVS